MLLRTGWTFEIMINLKYVKLYCIEYTEIENYNKAFSDETQIWDCHHKKEIEEGKNQEQLKKEGLYYNRPPEELIFLTSNEHHKLHSLNMSEEWKRKNSEAHKGKKRKPFTEESKMKMSEAAKRRSTEEYKTKMSLAKRGKKRKPFTEEHRKHISEARKKYYQDKQRGLIK